MMQVPWRRPPLVGVLLVVRTVAAPVGQAANEPGTYALAYEQFRSTCPPGSLTRHGRTKTSSKHFLVLAAPGTLRGTRQMSAR
jgi:hypothetical protein